jgi:hypothetical protein
MLPFHSKAWARRQAGLNATILSLRIDNSSLEDRKTTSWAKLRPNAVCRDVAVSRTVKNPFLNRGACGRFLIRRGSGSLREAPSLTGRHFAALEIRKDSSEEGTQLRRLQSREAAVVIVLTKERRGRRKEMAKAR